MAANPSPPPGSIQVQPVSASGGSPAQSGSNATVSTGQAWAGSGSQDTTAAHCGVNASAGSTGYAAQPQQVNTSGASSPNCTSASGTGNQSTANGNQSTTNGNQPAAGQTNPLGRTTASGTTAGSSSNALKPAASVAGLAGFAGWFGWLFLLLLLATLFLLLGFAVGRRRREPAAA
jgi:hypothetical protein